MIAQVRNYTETGFLKIKAPDSVFKIVKEFWDANRDMQTIEWKSVNPYHNSWEAPPTILRVDNKTLIGGGPHLQAAIANAARDAMEVRSSSETVCRARYFHSCSMLTSCSTLPKKGLDRHAAGVHIGIRYSDLSQ